MATTLKSVSNTATGEREQVFEAFRRYGYLQADLDPLGHLRPEPHPELEQLRGEAAEEARAIYSGTIGAEFMHINDRERRRWVAERMESEPAPVDRERVLERLITAELFEQVLQSRYLGTKRFSLEGNASLIPLLDEAMNAAGERGAELIMLAMSHRGRLNVMGNIVGRPAADIFAKFEDVDPRSVLGSGDVKYHVGATGEYTTAGGKKLNLHLVSNPSHLEAVDPVVIGRARAKQVRRGADGKQAVLPIVLHGDGAFAGQGILAETLNLSGVAGYDVGGTLHVVVNNLIGFTTSPEELHTSRFAADIAKRLPIPVFHVNADDPEAVIRVARWAAEYRYEFGSDVVIDLIGYRRHGHSEVDDPTVTQPLLYKRIEARRRTWEIYAERIGVDASATAARIREQLMEAQRQASGYKKKPKMATLPGYWLAYRCGAWKPEYEVETGVQRAELQRLGEGLARAPEGFHVHPKIKKLLEQRAEMAAGKRAVDYGMAEALAFASLVTQGTPIRLSGQDTRRGTFNQRHAALIDIETEEQYVPLQHLAPDQASCEIYNSTLSEQGVLGFEYGYSRDYPEALVGWEAQFGDFANGAQIIIDQFISAGEDKWGLLSGVVL